MSTKTTRNLLSQRRMPVNGRACYCLIDNINQGRFLKKYWTCTPY